LEDIAPIDEMTISRQIFLNIHNHYKDKYYLSLSLF